MCRECDKNSLCLLKFKHQDTLESIEKLVKCEVLRVKDDRSILQYATETELENKEVVRNFVILFNKVFI